MSVFVGGPRTATGFLGASKILPLAPRSNFLQSQTSLFSTRSRKTTKSTRLFPEEVNILYDSKCNVCKLEIDFLRRRDEKLAKKRATNGLAPQPKLKFTDLESGNYNSADPANGGITYETGMASMHAVTANGKVMNGVPVFRLAYEQVNLGWLFAVTEIRFVKQIADWVYNLFAKYRTNITRGQSVESLIEVYREKKDLEEKQQAEDCELCQENSTK